MGDHEERNHFVKRVILPSGKTIEVLYLRDAPVAAPVQEAVRGAAPDRDLHCCCDCGAELVYPVEWEEAGPENWSVLLHCPNCDVFREGVFAQETVERFDEELDRGAHALARDYRRLVRANMTEETDRFVGALRTGAILPEDF